MFKQTRRWKLLSALTFAVAASGASASMNEVVVDGIQVEFGVMSAEPLRGYPPGSVEATMHGGVPKGEGQYHVNVSLFDAATHAPITDARVEAEMDQAGFAPIRKPLELMKAYGGASYGNYFHVTGRAPYTVTVRVRKAGALHVTEAKFRSESD